MSLLRLSLGETRRRPLRALLTLLGLTIGVATTLAIALAIHTTRATYRGMFEELTGRASLEVVAAGGGGFDPASLDWLEAEPEIEAVIPVLQSPVAILGRAGPTLAIAVGIDPARDAPARRFRLHAGSALGEERGVLLDHGFAESMDIALGAEVTLVTPGGLARLPVLGLIASEGLSLVLDGAVVVLPLAAAQQLFRLEGQVNTLQLVLAESAATRRVRERLSARLPAGFRVQAPAARGALAEVSLAGAEQGLAVLGLVSPLAGAFVIVNTILMSLNERRRQFAIVRALGTTRTQLARWLRIEALALGVAGTLLGWVVGIALAALMTALLEQAFHIELPPLVAAPAPFILSGLLGPIMALAATAVPVRTSSRRPPLDDLADAHSRAAARLPRWPGAAGAGLLLLLLGLEVGYVCDLFSPRVRDALLAPGMMCFLLACMLLLPFGIVPLLRASAALCRPFLGSEGALALRQLERQPLRTALTAGTLFSAIVVSIGMGNTLLNNIDDLGTWFDRTIQADYFLRSVFPETGMLTAAALPEGCDAEVARLPGVSRIERVSFFAAETAGGVPILVLARSYFPDRPLPVDLAEGDACAALDGLLGGETVIGTALARRLGLEPGSEIEIATRTGPRPIRVAATATMYEVGGFALTLDWKHATALLGTSGVQVLCVTAVGGEREAVGERLAQLAGARRLVLQSLADLRAVVDGMRVRVAAAFWVLIGLVFVVASLGIVNTLSMNVLDQTREIGVLRAIAMRRRQVRKLVLAQGIHISLVSLIPGLGIGCALAWLMSLAAEPVSGFPVEFSLEPGCVAGCLLVAVGVTLCAAYLPARRAARLAIVDALQYE